MGKLQHYRNIHKNKTIIVCGCGHSLLSLPDTQDFITIGVNDVGRIFEPTYLVVLNPEEQFQQGRYHYIENSRAEAVFSQLDIFLKNSKHVKFKLGRYGGTNCFSDDTLNFTQNSPYVAICLAAYMGAKTIGLVGVDFLDGNAYGDNATQPLRQKLQTINHEYGKLYHTLKSSGIALVNLSSESLITAIPKISFNLLGKTDNFPINIISKKNINILNISKTNCAGSLWNLHNLINNHSPHKSRVVTASNITSGRTYPLDVRLSDINSVNKLIHWADIIHFHNWIDKESPEMNPFRDLLQNKPAVLMFHSGPDVLQPKFPDRCLISRKDITTLTVAQKQARFYPNAKIVPNAIDISSKQLQVLPKDRSNTLITVLYTPTDKKDYENYETTCSGKGYNKTVKILKKLHNQGIIHSEVHTSLPFDEIIKLRRTADIVIDECVTGGYHLTSLESLSQGIATIAYLDNKTQQLLSNITHCSASELPWLNTPIDELENRLKELSKDRLLLDSIKRKSLDWMQTYWYPKKVVEAYCKIYFQELSYEKNKQNTTCKTQLVFTNPTRRKLAQQFPVHYKLKGKKFPRCSEEFEQTIKLSKKLMLLKSAYHEQSCHILGSGPSINSFDCSVLESRTVITVNASAILDSALGRPSDFYCVSDRRFLDNEATKQIAQSSAATYKVFAGYCCGFVDDKHINYARIVGGLGISSDLENGFYHNCSVTIFAAQLALWLGFTNIYLHGCEFNYSNGRFCKQNNLPNDQDTYHRIEKGVQILARTMNTLGGALNLVGDSRLAGDFGARNIQYINKISQEELYTELEQDNSYLGINKSSSQKILRSLTKRL